MDDTSLLSESVLKVDAPKAPVEKNLKKRSDESFLRVWEDVDGLGESHKAGPSKRNVESEGTRIEPDGLNVEDPPSSSKETPLRVLNEGEDGVKSPIELTAARLEGQGKVRLDIRVEPDMVLQHVGVDVLTSAVDGSASAEESAAAVKFNALATDKNKWYAILREKQHSLMAEKYKEFRGAS